MVPGCFHIENRRKYTEKYTDSAFPNIMPVHVPCLKICQHAMNIHKIFTFHSAGIMV